MLLDGIVVADARIVNMNTRIEAIDKRLERYIILKRIPINNLIFFSHVMIFTQHGMIVFFLLIVIIRV